MKIISLVGLRKVLPALGRILILLFMLGLILPRLIDIVSGLLFPKTHHFRGATEVVVQGPGPASTLDVMFRDVVDGLQRFYRGN